MPQQLPKTLQKPHSNGHATTQQLLRTPIKHKAGPKQPPRTPYKTPLQLHRRQRVFYGQTPLTPEQLPRTPSEMHNNALAMTQIHLENTLKNT